MTLVLDADTIPGLGTVVKIVVDPYLDGSPFDYYLFSSPEAIGEAFREGQLIRRMELAYGPAWASDGMGV